MAAWKVAEEARTGLFVATRGSSPGSSRSHTVCADKSCRYWELERRLGR